MKIDWRELISDLITLLILLGGMFLALFLYSGIEDVPK